MNNIIIFFVIIILVISCRNSGNKLSQSVVDNNFTKTMTEENINIDFTLLNDEKMDNDFSNTITEYYLNINLPSLSEGKVEKLGEKIYFSNGAEFSVSLENIENNDIPNVIWTIMDNVDSGTTINNGVLTVANDDHGKSLTIVATLAETGISSTATIDVVFCFPSYFYGTWIRVYDDYTITAIISYDTLEIKNNRVMANNKNVPYHMVINNLRWFISDWGLDSRPGGYFIRGYVENYFEGGGDDFKAGERISAIFYPRPDRNSFSWIEDTSVYIKISP